MKNGVVADELRLMLVKQLLKRQERVEEIKLKSTLAKPDIIRIAVSKRRGKHLLQLGGVEDQERLLWVDSLDLVLGGGLVDTQRYPVVDFESRWLSLGECSEEALD